MIYRTVDDEPTEYIETHAYIDIWDDGQRVYRVPRTGICCPGPWPARAVYEYKGEYYVLDAGQLIPSAEWHDHAKRQSWPPVKLTR